MKIENGNVKDKINSMYEKKECHDCDENLTETGICKICGKDHNCKKHLDVNAICKICGKDLIKWEIYENSNRSLLLNFLHLNKH